MSKTDSRKQFDKFVGKVLNFTCIWDDSEALYGDKHTYHLNYFLSDDTMEVLEIIQANSGRAPFPVMLHRALVPKIPKPGIMDAYGVNGVQDPEPEGNFYKWADLSVGQSIRIHSRELLIADANEFTYQFYESQGMSMRGQEVNTYEPEPVKPVITYAPYNGYGDQEDSLGSCTHLVPKPPKKDFAKRHDNAMKVLRFDAQMKEAGDTDLERRFIIRFFLDEDMIDVCEKPKRNSGIVAGRYMSKCPIFKNGNSGDRVLASDLGKDAEVVLKGVTFLITGVDQYTQNHQDEAAAMNPDGWQ